VGDLAEICLSGPLHIGEYNGADLFGCLLRFETSVTYEFLDIMLVPYLDGRLSAVDGLNGQCF